MRHKSIKLDTPVEFINIQPMNPLISKCDIKVCYVGDEPNRNRSIITKETARQMANSLPGCPIVGFYNEGNEDFEEHNRVIDISNGKFEIKDTTRPYGFVDLNAKVWFQKFLDDDKNEHEYMMTEGYLWTEQYPECKRVISQGNNQSMELHEETIDASWTKDDKGNPEFFIINEAIISKLCILGEDCEPCFEGSTITDSVQFSFDDGFKQQVFAMMNELKELIENKGGANMFNKYAVEIGDGLWNSLYSYLEQTWPEQHDGWVSSKYCIEGIYEEQATKFAILRDRADGKYYRLNFAINNDGYEFESNLTEVTKTYVPVSTEPQFALEAIEAYEAERYKKSEGKSEQEEDSKNDNNSEEEKCPKCGKPKNECTCDDSEDKKFACNCGNEDCDGNHEEEPQQEEEEAPAEENATEEPEAKYSLDEIPEYIELQNRYSALEEQFNALKAEKEALELEVAPLKEFKAMAERTAKEDMINSFYMLTEEDKKDVVENIDKYSLDDIEAKLSIICVRNKVSFSLEEDDNNNEEDPTTFNLEGVPAPEDNMPAWVKAALETAKEME